MRIRNGERKKYKRQRKGKEKASKEREMTEENRSIWLREDV